jgi:hypothetical protein
MSLTLSIIFLFKSKVGSQTDSFYAKILLSPHHVLEAEKFCSVDPDLPLIPDLFPGH